VTVVSDAFDAALCDAPLLVREEEDLRWFMPMLHFKLQIFGSKGWCRISFRNWLQWQPHHLVDRADTAYANAVATRGGNTQM